MISDPLWATTCNSLSIRRQLQQNHALEEGQEIPEFQKNLLGEKRVNRHKLQKIKHKLLDAVTQGNGIKIVLQYITSHKVWREGSELRDGSESSVPAETVNYIKNESLKIDLKSRQGIFLVNPVGAGSAAEGPDSWLSLYFWEPQVV